MEEGESTSPPRWKISCASWPRSATWIPDVVMSAGSRDAAKKWQQLITFLADHAFECAETGYNTEPLRDELGTLAWTIF